MSCFVAVWVRAEVRAARNVPVARRQEGCDDRAIFSSDDPFLPSYIPQDVDMTAVKAEVAALGVSAPPAATPGLLEVVQHARDEGIDLKIVLLDHNPPNDTPLRDIATVVGADYSDATVLVLSPNYVGSYSTQYPRVTLEAGKTIQDRQSGAVRAELCP